MLTKLAKLTILEYKTMTCLYVKYLCIGDYVVLEFYHDLSGALGKKATIHHLTTMLATSINVLFPGHNHLLTTGIDDPTL